MTEPRMLALMLVLFATSLVAWAPADAFDGSSKVGVNMSRSGLALKGYDPVAYFTLGKPARGKAEFFASHGGATYRFVTAEHRDSFLKEPGRYAPQYGGFCAYAVGHGYKADADPTAWNIVDGRLYVNYNASVGRTWAASAKPLIVKGDANWPRISTKAPDALGR